MKKTISKQGKVQITGIPKALKQSGAYPWAFGLALGALVKCTGAPSSSGETCLV